MRRFCSIFSQLLPLISPLDFENAVRETRAERHARGFASWDQLVAMMFCQLGRAHSLREICGGLACCEGKLGHLRMRGAPKRSTLAYANQHRPWQLYERLFHAMLGRIQREALGRHKFRFKNKLVSLDASVIDLCAESFEWARFGPTKGAVKLHLQLAHDGYLPCFALIGAGSQHEITVARSLRYQAGSILVFDRGYLDYEWFGALSAQEVWFVTRLKENAVSEVLAERAVPQGRNVLRDQTIMIGGHGGGRKCPLPLRRVEFQEPATGKVLVFLTNNFKLGSSTVAAIYKERWQIELFFKAIKQNLKIKTFLGTSANALKTQLWTALIAMLLLRYLQLKARYGWSLSNLVAFLRMNLFVHRDLWAWLNEPFSPPPDLPQEMQHRLVWA